MNEPSEAEEDDYFHPPQPAKVRIPVWATAWDAYRVVGTDRRTFVPLAAGLFAVLVATQYATGIQDTEAEDAEGILALLSLVEFLAAALFAVAWHRRLLADAAGPTEAGGQERRRSFLRCFLRYLLYAVLILALSMLLVLAGLAVLMLPAVFGQAIKGWEEASGLPLVYGVLIVAMLGGVALGLLLAVHLLLVLPASAVGLRVSLRQSWFRTKGNGWRIALALVVASFVPCLPLYVLPQPLNASAVLLQAVTTAAVWVVVSTGAVGVSSLALRRLWIEPESQSAGT